MINNAAMTFQGVYAPIPTPFVDGDRLDAVRLRALVARLAGSLTGLVVLGSNGEAPLMDEEESDRAVAAAREAMPPGRQLIAGTGRESTAGTIAATRRAAALGADAVLVRTPGFFKSLMTSDLFVGHYTSVADASPVPVLLYNFTAVTGVDLLPDAAARLAGHPNIAGMKESGGNVARIAEIVSAAPPGFTVLAGSASTFLPSLGAGARGGILALANVLPAPCMRVFELHREDNTDEAHALQERLLPMARLLSAHGVAALKAALALAGCDVGAPRPPLVPASDAVRAALRTALAAFQEVPA